MNRKKAKIFITGGHTTPAIACIEELKKRGDTNLLYIGQYKSILFDKNPSAEYCLITEKVKLPFKAIYAGKFSLFFNLNSFIWALRLPIGFIQALYWQVRYRPKLVLTFGSHVGVPVVFWAYIFKTPIIAHEQTVTLGRSNKFIEKYATKVCYSWENTLGSIGRNLKKGIFTGNPIRKEIFSVTTNTFTFSDLSKKTIFITGGNQGAHALNKFIFQNLEKITQKYNVIHQTGSNSIYNDFSKANDLAEDLNKNGIVYIPRNYLFVEEMAESYHKAFVLITRAGANTVTELIALEKKAILIPITTTSGNEQFLNANLLKELGLGIILNQTELEKVNIMQVLDEAEKLRIKDEKKIKELSSKHINAHIEIVNTVEQVMGI